MSSISLPPVARSLLFRPLLSLSMNLSPCLYTHISYIRSYKVTFVYESLPELYRNYGTTRLLNNTQLFSYSV